MTTFLDPFRPDEYRRKPARHLTEINPQGKLREGLLAAILFEPGNWQRDYVNPGLGFTIGGTPTFAATSLGGGTVAPGTNGYLLVSPQVTLPASSWSMSVNALFTGAYQPDVTYFAVDHFGDAFFFIQGSNGSVPGAMTFNASNNVASWSAANYTGWHRITIASTGSSCTFYFDGVSQGSNSISPNVGELFGIMGNASRNSAVGTQISDMFLWSYMLSDQQVAMHAADPYGTVLRPRYPSLARRGIPPNGRHPSLLTTGVGP